MFDILPDRLYKWYRDHLSDYSSDKLNGNYPPKFVEDIDEVTGEVIEEKSICIFKPENIGERMSIDDKAIGHDGYTILSNTQTNKIAMMIENTKGKIVDKALSLFERALLKVKSISSDMSATYLKLCEEHLLCAAIVIDKFHVMRYVYDVVLDVRTKIKKELTEGLSKEKKKTEQDKIILQDIELLNRSRNRLTQGEDKWSESTKELMIQLFSKYDELKRAYILIQNFKKWYGRNAHNDRKIAESKLQDWYNEVKESKIKEFTSVLKMIRKHEPEILNYFSCGHTNASAERLNGKIQCFVSNNYGMRDKDFSLYRIAIYFS
jgi:transposase